MWLYGLNKMTDYLMVECEHSIQNLLINIIIKSVVKT